MNIVYTSPWCPALMHIIIVMELWKFPKVDEEYALYYREKKNIESESVAFFVAE